MADDKKRKNPGQKSIGSSGPRRKIGDSFSKTSINRSKGPSGISSDKK